MKGTKIIACGLALCGCAKDTPVSDTLTENAINATTALEQSLPKECKTDVIATQITVLKTEIRSISKACQAEKELITRDKLKWKLAFWALTGVVLAYVMRKILQ